MFARFDFSDLIFADVGNKIFVDSGWDNYPAPDCNRLDWEKIDSTCNEAEALNKGEAEWTVIK